MLDDGEKSPLHHWKGFYKSAREGQQPQDNDENNPDASLFVVNEIEKINEELTEAINDSNQQPQLLAALYCKRAKAKEKNKDYEDAIEDYKEALKIDDTLHTAAF
jgi:tetratricopeptide (TPR) repeat protein